MVSISLPSSRSERLAFMKTPDGKAFCYRLYRAGGIALVVSHFECHINTARKRVAEGRQIEEGRTPARDTANHVTPENCEGSRDSRDCTQFSTTNEKEN